MKKIESVSIWNNGKSEDANLLIAIISSDNLSSFCNLEYKLCSSTEEIDDINFHIGNVLSNGYITMDGDAYLEWDGSNDYAYNYIANKLNLTIV